MPTTTGKATDFITFSRASLATVTDSDGRIKWAGHNLLTNSESFDASAWLKINNASTNPAVTANAAAAPNSTTTADRVDFGVIDAAADYSIIYQQQTVVAGTHTAAFWVKAFAAGDVGKKIWAFIYNNTTKGLQTVTLTADWQYITMSGSMDAGAAQLQIGTFGSSAVTGGENQAAVSVLLWGAHLYRSDLGGMVANTSAYPMYNPTTPKNLLGFTEDFSNAAWIKTRVLAFGSGSVANAIVAPNGLQTADLVVPNTVSGTHAVDQLITVVSTTPYRSSIYVRAAGYSKIGLYDNGGANRWSTFNLSGSGSVIANGASATGAITALPDGWYRISLANNAGSSSYNLIVYLLDDAYSSGTPFSYTYTGDGTSGIYLWGAQLSYSASLDPYVANAFAAPTAAAYHGPRLDFDPVTLAARGLLVEEQRTNIALQSADLATTWTTVTASVSANSTATTAPDGSTAADKIIVDNAEALDASGVTQTITAAAATYTYSIFAKAAEFNRVSVRVRDNATATNNAGVIVSLVDGSITTAAAAAGTFTGASASVTSIGNGWYRVALTFTSTGATSLRIRVFLSDSVATTGDGTSGIYAWGAQLEAGSFATSYIPTGASTVTRSADVASVATSAFPYSASEGTLVVSALKSSLTAADSASATLFTSVNDVIEMYVSSGNSRLYGATSGASFTLLDSNKIVAGSVFKSGVAFKQNDYALVTNGGAAQTNTTANVPVVTTLGIGSRDGNVPFRGWIRQITYIPRRLSNTELQARTV